MKKVEDKQVMQQARSAVTNILSIKLLIVKGIVDSVLFLVFQC